MITFEVINGEVLQVEQIETGTQTAIVKSHYDREFHTVLSYASGIVTANVFTWEEQPASTYNNTVTFEYDGQTVTAQAVNGIASITFSSTIPGAHVVRTTNTDLRNGEVTINV